MVRTRAGHDVVYTEASYGRAARTESRRRMQKRKFERQDQGGESGTAASTPQRARRTRGQIRQEELSTPPSATVRLGVTPPSQDEIMLRGRLPTCSDYGISRHFSFNQNHNQPAVSASAASGDTRGTYVEEGVMVEDVVMMHGMTRDMRNFLLSNSRVRLL